MQFLTLCLISSLNLLTFWRRNYYFLILGHPVLKNVDNTGTKQVRIMKQTAFKKNGEDTPCLKYSVPIFVE